MKSIVQKIKAFHKRWDISSNTAYKDEFLKFKTRVLNIFRDVDMHVSKEGITQFCQILGIVEEWQELGSVRFSRNILNALIMENDEKKFYFLLQVISYLPIVEDHGQYGISEPYNRQLLFKGLVEVIELSRVNLAIAFHGKEVILYPAGEKRLDEELVDEVLGFLQGACQKHFTEALKFYEAKQPHKSSESLRRTLEEFLRVKLKNQQGLDKNILELQKKLKVRDADASIRNVIFQVFSYLDKYFNENSKHHDGLIREAENEYLIYQVGLLMRYIHKTL